MIGIPTMGGKHLYTDTPHCAQYDRLEPKIKKVQSREKWTLGYSVTEVWNGSTDGIEYIDGLVWDCGISSALAMEILHCSLAPSLWHVVK